MRSQSASKRTAASVDNARRKSWRREKEEGPGKPGLHPFGTTAWDKTRNWDKTWKMARKKDLAKKRTRMGGALSAGVAGAPVPRFAPVFTGATALWRSAVTGM